MAIQIINCPECGTFLLDDTAECHACGHVLNADLAATTKRSSLPTDQAVGEDMDICPTCGESCRKGLVRCWNCGSFTRPDIEQAYRNRSSSDTVMDKFDLPELDATSINEEGSMKRRAWSTPENFMSAPPLAREENEGDDFELSDDVRMSEADDSSFDLSEEISLRSEDDSSFELSSEIPLRSDLDHYDIPDPGYSLQPSNPTPAEIPSVTSDETAETIPLLSSSAPDGDAETEAAIPMSLDGGKPAPKSKAKPVLTPEEELLKIAADEEAEIMRLRKGFRTKESFVVFCPQGHRIRVREKFRGKTGKCPRCESVFIVPQKTSPKPKQKTDVEVATVGGSAPAGVTGRYSRWLNDVHLHTVVPEKLKLKADSLLNDFQTVDLGFNPDEILIVTLVAAGGLFGGGAKKKPAVRTAMLEYFTNPAASPDRLTAAAKRVIAKDTFTQVVLAQPVPLGTESLFGNIPIFGAGRIAVRLPRAADDKNTQYLSFSLSEFRAFALALQSVCGLEAFGANTEIPMVDHYETFKCHYNETPVRSLQQLEYYQKDTNFKLEISGWRCSGCKLIVSEDARKKEKIGGLNGKGIAKAKCPKCTQKFGSNPLYALPEAAAPAPVDVAEATAEQPVPGA
eukprot:TRINITY_DN493_c1_g1_i5.p1 TRINITY_DN493_c1_g1~~TRINITY_DN493_c1_g1_i5.p1  ORF type:complete len:625 (+),score=162.37 TRINITY_DN493_c1_g1_i5:2061-3935(+)